MTTINPLSKAAQKMMAHRIRREVKRQLAGGAQNHGEPQLTEGQDPLLASFFFGVPIMIPQRHPGEKVKLRFISWEDYKGIRRGSCCGDLDD